MRVLALALLLFSHSLFAQPTIKPVEEFKLSDHQGQLIYLDFWASWCVPCRASFPWMADMRARYEKQGLSIITVNLDESVSDAQRFLKELNSDLAVLHDPQGTWAQRYDLQGMPSSFLLNDKAEVLHSHVGFRKKDQTELEQLIQTHLAR